MACAMSLDTIFSYIFWKNLEPAQGNWDSERRNGLSKFFRIAEEEGLHVALFVRGRTYAASTNGAAFRRD